MDDLTQAWMEEEALHGDEELIVVARCGWAGHGECGGVLYGPKKGKQVMCHRHLVLHDVWWTMTSTEKDFTDWLDGLENDTARIMYESNQESVCMDCWREI